MKAFITILSLVFLSITSFAHETSYEDAIQKLMEENIRKPIIYGVGAGGLSLENSFYESRKILTPIERGPFKEGAALYRESLIVMWSDIDEEGDRSPRMIIPIGGYLGKMEAGEFGQIDYSTKFLKYKEKGLEGSWQLAIDLFNEFEKKDSSYDCIQSIECRVIYGDENQRNFVIVLPGAVLLLAKEEFQIGEIRIPQMLQPEENTTEE